MVLERNPLESLLPFIDFLVETAEYKMPVFSIEENDV